MCGEYSNRFFLIDTSQGSPPHTWRIPAPSSVFHSSVGITSTYVENTLHLLALLHCLEYHLHIRGEYQHLWTHMMLCMRITSTYVENTPLKLIVVLSSEDHLHIRGEYQLARSTRVLLEGSPPHTWRILNTRFM